MKQYFKPFLLSLPLFSFILTACVAKPVNGKYISQYSYHPYYDMYPNKILGRKKTSPYTHRVAYNDDERYPSNVPSNNY